MPVMSYGQSNFGINLPVGRYTARFLGTESRPAIQGGQYGNDGSPRMAFIWEVTEGEQIGGKIIQETGCAPSPKSECARMLLGLAGRELQQKEQIDTDSFINKIYSVKVAVNPKSDKGSLHVGDLEPVGRNGSPATAAPASRPGKPPARPGAAPAAAPADARRWWVVVPNSPDDAEPREMTRADVQKLIDDTKTAPADLAVCLTTEAEWKTAADYGFNPSSPIPW